MTEYDEVVHVETLDEYRTVLENWFKKGYNWYYNSTGKYDIYDDYFTLNNARYLVLDGKTIHHSTGRAIDTTKAISFKEFMAKEHGKVTYEVSEDQRVFIKEVKESPYPAAYLMGHNYVYEALFSAGDYDPEFERDLLRYLGGDANVAFKLKDPLYLLKGKDSDGCNAYFTFNLSEAPTYTYVKSEAFKAPREEIIRWYNPFWKVEEVKEDD